MAGSSARGLEGGAAGFSRQKRGAARPPKTGIGEGNIKRTVKDGGSCSRGTRSKARGRPDWATGRQGQGSPGVSCRGGHGGKKGYETKPEARRGGGVKRCSDLSERGKCVREGGT